jgi:hypothetical protein
MKKIFAILIFMAPAFAFAQVWDDLDGTSAGYGNISRLGNVGIGDFSQQNPPLGPLHIKTLGPQLRLEQLYPWDQQNRPGILLKGNDIVYFEADDIRQPNGGDYEEFVFTSSFAPNRNRPSLVKVHGNGQWNDYIGATHIGGHGELITGLGDIRLKPNSGLTRAYGKLSVGAKMPTVPDWQFGVDGIIYCKELNVDVNVWADYVFKADYQLMPLAEVERYIKAHQHLPGIASADEVMEKGVNVAQMEVQLLQKVEELTLYIIELEKRIKTLETK